MAGKKREKPATGGFRKDYDGLTLWHEDSDYDVLEDSKCRDIIKAGGLEPTDEFVSAIKAEISRYVYWRKLEQGAPHGGGSGRVSDFWEEHACKMIKLYESFGGTYELGRRNPSRDNCKMIKLYESFGGTYELERRNPSRKNPKGSVGSPFLSFALAINEALAEVSEFHRIGRAPETIARAIRRAYQNAKDR